MDTKPLPAAALHILAALAEGDCHGYAAMQRVRERSGGAVPMQTGSFYRHLARLIDGGLVQPIAKRRPGDDPRRGDYYHLTVRGREALAAERRRLADLIAALKPRKA
jgi:DNA-binding PadR family transcriptional regulator